MAMDEARFGLINWHKRRYCPLGIRPPWVVQRKYEWSWFYSALEPMTGESFSLYLPVLDGLCFECFLAHLAQAFPDEFILLFADNAPAHRKSDLSIPSNIIILNFPPYSPELNPVERFFQEFRRALANRTFDSLEQLHHALSHTLETFTADKERLELLTNFPWWHFGVASLQEM